ncbi:class I SAM-dependent methyltransferase [Sphingopyxis sp. KK2]|uniref:class I SAM-dependent methyltransferase n=1 Tax=Sphingopyxis sp. KK2 TaxID=1855727 RepID=UPI00097E5E02|nr:SAM-dependent methyltransferase [Sphingopyxis sp. KK2]
MPDSGPLADLWRHGPVSIADYMGAANGHYYATRDPLGAAGDFTTAPEISQMFGELVGIWCADLWDRAGRPAFRYVELGPGRGTLAADALRAMRRFGCNPVGIELVETSPSLRAAQLARIPDAAHHDSVESLPGDAALIVVANEFFDALPVRQLLATPEGWRERLVARDGARLVTLHSDAPVDSDVPPSLRSQPAGTVIETSPASIAAMHRCARSIAQAGGAMLAIDYGYRGPAAGDTLQAVSNHRYADPFERAGEVDLTAHVDFTALGDAARSGGLTVAGPVGQGLWLQRLGIDARLQALIATSPARAEELEGQRHRLVEAGEMGELFQVLTAHAAAWPTPTGFTA